MTERYDLRHADRVGDRTNCPNCGAPIADGECPYCGSKFIDFACMKTDEPFFMKIQDPRGMIHLFKVRLRNVSFVNPSEDAVDAYGLNNVRRMIFSQWDLPTVTLEMAIFPFKEVGTGGNE